jgi:hypothetical protein
MTDWNDLDGRQRSVRSASPITKKDLLLTILLPENEVQLVQEKIAIEVVAHGFTRFPNLKAIDTTSSSSLFSATEITSLAISKLDCIQA